ncbi:Nrap protein [Rhizopogon vinicolor AM-OR11-026]|uniref:U3 small nucleolar RNA-associated protein 22 n=1 Tax=Rhizopogon vinicolor AM-OR11-026 TaxID=1314800 RepID=A0A1B7NAI8_9AGAM|nr:Nrap protein [Rhizopogon vinicolor AM-OR11-026]
MDMSESDRHGEEGPLTGHELKDIKDAADLYQSGSFKLQIDALLPNVRPKESARQQLDRFLLSLRNHILSLPSIIPQNPLTAAQTLAKQGVAVPFVHPLPSRDDKWKVAFEPPMEINIVGSWGNGIAVKKKNGGRFGVDLSVEMPYSLFQEKDYLDGRFFHKKSYYLAVLAQSISTSFDVDTFYASPLGDPRLTTLVIRPRKGSTSHDFSKSHADIYIIPILPSPNPLPPAKLSPSHSNVRIPSVLPSPSPIYNNAVLLSTYPKLALLSTHELKNSSPAFHDAHTLLRVWANQRGYGDGELCVKGFEGKGSFWTGLLRLLVSGEEPVATKSGNAKLRRPLGKGLSSYQLFKAALDFLAKQKFDETPAFTKAIDGHKYPLEEYIAHHPAVFVDRTSTINFLSDVPLTSLDLISHDAKETLEQLNNPGTSDDVFAECFLKSERGLFTRFDAVVGVDLPQATQNQSALAVVEHGSPDAALLASVASILRRGLGDRTKAIAILQPGTPFRPISSAQSPSTSTIHIGLIYDPAHAFRLVDHGPSAENQDSSVAEEFRHLWGNRAELRRFKDGRIAESVVWEVATSDERAHIPVSIIRHLLQLHFGISAEHVRTLQTPFDSMLRLPDDVRRLHRAAGGYKAAVTAFDDIVRNLKALDEQLPLALLNVSPISEYLRYTSTFAPLPVSASTLMALPESLRFLPTIPIILEFEKSSKWPDDLKAIQKVKLAFFESIARSLMVSKPGLKASVAIGDSSTPFQGLATLEIFAAEGWAFSASIWHDREATLLDRIIGSSKTLAPSDQEHSVREQREAKAARELYTRTFIHSPRHHRAIANLCHKYSAYSGTVRLVKRWLAVHWLLRSHVSEEAIEIICARPFVGGKQTSTEDAATVPHSKERGFALVIEFLGDWKWEEPLFIPLYEDNTPAPAPEIVAVSAKQGVWTLSTAEDRTGRMWTSYGPDHVSAHRLRALAKEAIKIIQDAETDSDIKRLFSHSTDDYDVVIELNSAVLPRYYQNVNANSSVWSRDSHSGVVESTPRPGFDPLPLFLADLQSTFADTLKFFADPFGGDRIGAIWLPDLKAPRPFRALAGFSSKPLPKEDKAKDKELVMLNRQSIIDDIERLGSGLIKNIVTR